MGWLLLLVLGFIGFKKVQETSAIKAEGMTEEVAVAEAVVSDVKHIATPQLPEVQASLQEIQANLQAAKENIVQAYKEREQGHLEQSEQLKAVAEQHLSHIQQVSSTIRAELPERVVKKKTMPVVMRIMRPQPAPPPGAPAGGSWRASRDESLQVYAYNPTSGTPDFDIYQTRWFLPDGTEITRLEYSALTHVTLAVSLEDEVRRDYEVRPLPGEDDYEVHILPVPYPEAE